MKIGSPDVRNRHPYKNITLISAISKHSFSELRTNKQKTKKNPSVIIVIYFCIPHYDTDNYVASDFNIGGFFLKNIRLVDLVFWEK